MKYGPPIFARYAAAALKRRPCVRTCTCVRACTASCCSQVHEDRQRTVFDCAQSCALTLLGNSVPLYSRLLVRIKSLTSDKGAATAPTTTTTPTTTTCHLQAACAPARPLIPPDEMTENGEPPPFFLVVGSPTSWASSLGDKWAALRRCGFWGWPDADPQTNERRRGRV